MGGGLYVAAVASTTIILSILAGVKREERDRSRRQTLRFRLHVERGRRDRYVGGGARDAVATEAAVVQRSEADDLDDVTIVMERIGARDARTVVDDVRTLPYVRDVQDDA